MKYKEYFDILEIEPTNEIAEIKSGYKKCLLKYHPDKVNQSDKGALKIANIKTVSIINAYEILKSNLIYLDQFEKIISDVEINWDIRKGIISSNIEWIEYYKNLYILIVKFKSGGLYLYKNVDFNTYSGLITAESKGKFLHKYIAFKFNYHRLSNYDEWYRYGKQIYYRQLN